MYVSQFFQRLFNARYVSICFRSQFEKKNLEIERQKLNNIFRPVAQVYRLPMKLFDQNHLASRFY